MTHDPSAPPIHGPDTKVGAYFAVFVALSVFTAVSFGANWMVHHGSLSSEAAFAIILGVAIVKACLVGMIFMHLKWDWRKLYFMIAPAFILAPFLVFALLPDLVLAWRNVSGK